MNIKILFLSDTHFQHHGLTKKKWLPKADIICHAGDVCSRGSISEALDFLDWFSNLTQYSTKLFISGNHDWCFQDYPNELKEKIPENVIYLNDSGCEIEGIKFWGSPITPTFLNWSFNRDRGPEIQKHWDLIPTDTDVLITHGPPLGYGDMILEGESVGCADLLEKIKLIKPKYSIFGHIHEAFSTSKNEYTTFINASVLNRRYELVNKPILIEYIK